MARVIEAAQRVSQQAVTDLESGHPSHGFEHLFGRSEPVEIKKVFQKVIDGNPRTLAHSGILMGDNPDEDLLDFKALFSKNKQMQPSRFTNLMRPPYRGSGSPKVLCVNKSTEKQYKLPAEFRNLCGASLVRGQSRPQAMQIGETPWIFICSSFFKFPILPPSTQLVPKSKVCPSWNSSTLQPGPRGAWTEECFYHQVFFFIHECIHFYVPNALSWATTPKEVYDFHKGLIARQSSDLRRNPMNYQAYAASR